MQSISIKELRNNMPAVRNQLKKGEEFLVIYQSRPIAKLTPVSDIPVYEEATDKDIERAMLEDWGGDDLLSDEELEYYMNLISK